MHTAITLIPALLTIRKVKCWSYLIRISIRSALSPSWEIEGHQNTKALGNQSVSRTYAGWEQRCVSISHSHESSGHELILSHRGEVHPQKTHAKRKAAAPGSVQIHNPTISSTILFSSSHWGQPSTAPFHDPTDSPQLHTQRSLLWQFSERGREKKEVYAHKPIFNPYLLKQLSPTRRTSPDLPLWREMGKKGGKLWETAKAGWHFTSIKSSTTDNVKTSSSRNLQALTAHWYHLQLGTHLGIKKGRMEKECTMAVLQLWKGKLDVYGVSP